jgi:tocopherol O-methyltransferase
MHMGHYGEDGNEKKTDLKAQVDMVDRLLDWGLGLDPPPAKVLDVGCGVGGSSRHIARRFGSDVTGITLSFLQCEHANLRSANDGMSDLTHFLVADALNLPFEDNSFDLVWSLEPGACTRHPAMPHLRP